MAFATRGVRNCVPQRAQSWPGAAAGGDLVPVPHSICAVTDVAMASRKGGLLGGSGRKLELPPWLLAGWHTQEGRGEARGLG